MPWGSLLIVGFYGYIITGMRQKVKREDGGEG
jgi:hypothetical protein